MAIDLGDPLPNLSVQTRNAAGVLENAGSVVLTLTLPDLTTTTPTVSNPSPGVYEATYVTVQAGRHLARWVATGANTSAYTDAYVVRPANPASIISFAEAKAHLGEQSSLQDEEIRTYLEVASEIVESIAGPMSIRTVTERVRTGSISTRTSLRLRQTPIASVTSITSIASPSSTWVTADLDVDSELGYVTRLNGGSFTSGPWTAVYKAGRTDLQARYTQAVKEQLWHMWVTQRGQTADSLTPDLVDVADFESRGTFSTLGFLIPPRVRELFEFDLVPGTA